MVKIELTGLRDLSAREIRQLREQMRDLAAALATERPALAGLWQAAGLALQRAELLRERGELPTELGVPFETAADLDEFEWRVVGLHLLTERDKYARDGRSALATFWSDLLVAIDDEHRRRQAVGKLVDRALGGDVEAADLTGD